MSHPRYLTSATCTLRRATLLAMVLGALASAQDVDLTTRLRLAQSFEQVGDWERASSIYASLHETDPHNFVFFDGVRRCYIQLKQYGKAIALVERRLMLQPRDENLLSVLGGLYYQIGEPGKADSLWRVVLSSDPRNPNLYRLIASQMIEHRQYEQAAEIYRGARRALANEEVFIEELASLYSALHQYELATAEYVRMLRLRPQQRSYIEARLGFLTGREEGLRAALNVVRKEIRKAPTNIPLHSLLAWLFMEGKDLPSALIEYQTIDKLSNANGSELLQFGQRAMQEKAPFVAARAFQEVIGKQPALPVIAQARFGYARAIEELSFERDTAIQIGLATQRPLIAKPEDLPVSEVRPGFEGAVQLYESLVTDYPNSEMAMQALYRIGIIRFQRFFDLDGAAAAFDRLRKLPFNAALVNEATVSTAEVRVAQNDLAEARMEYRRLLAASPELYRDRVLFHLAELDFFEADFDSALAKLRAITANVNTDLANDALQLLYFIQENATAAPAGLRAFAKADLLMRQKKYSEALARFQELIQQYSTALLLDDAMMKTGELHLLLNQNSDALKVFGQIVSDMPMSILKDRAQMRIAEIYETRLRDKQKAVEAYEQLLIKYPTSLYREEARKRTRVLRGDLL